MGGGQAVRRERYACDRLMADMDHQAEQYLAMARRREFLSALERALERYEGADRVEVARRIALLRERVDAEDPGLHPERIDIAVPETRRCAARPVHGRLER